MIRKITLFLAVTISTFCFSQSMRSADELFENFEYAQAADAYLKNRVQSGLTNEQVDRLAFCLYIENRAEEGLKLSDSLLQKGSASKEIWFYKAHFERELGQFENAVNSAEKYLALGGEHLPLKFRESCFIHLNTPEFVEGELTNFDGNDQKINSLNYIGSSPVYFHEIGIDSLGNRLGIANEHGLDAQLLLMKPFLKKGEVFEEWIFVDEPGKELSINSIQFDSKDKKVYFAASLPSTVDPLLLVSHIYVGEATEVGNVINSYAPWQYSGFEDSSTCAHVALSSDGNTLVFSKLLKGRTDGDLYFSKKSNGTWTEPRQIPGVNTLSQEVFPVIQGDSILYFSSDGHIGYGGLDLFSIPFTDDWSHDTLTRLPMPYNSTSDDFNFRSAIAEKESIFVSNRRNGKGDDDIWKFRLAEKVQPVLVVADTVEKEIEAEFDVKGFLKECNSKRIYFSFNEGSTGEKFEFVEKLIDLEKEGYQFSITVTGYADARGTVPANYQVALRRAESVKKDLISRGIRSNSIQCVSKGATMIENRCKNAKIQCSEEEHRLNRYVQLTISMIE